MNSDSNPKAPCAAPFRSLQLARQLPLGFVPTAPGQPALRAVVADPPSPRRLTQADPAAVLQRSLPMWVLPET